MTATASRTFAEPRYQALALQVATQSVGHCPDRGTARAMMNSNIERLGDAIGSAINLIRQYQGGPVRLVVLPEYSITGAPTGGNIPAWRARAALDMDGPEYAALGRIAEANQIFLAGNAYESDPHFAPVYFQTSFLLSPAGVVALRYRRLVSLFSPTPYDLLERYLDRYGAESLFPVADTEIGRVAAIASEEILYPEIARCHAMRGAEVFIHSTSEMGSPRATAKDIGKRARAAENLAYLVSANASSVENTGLPSRSTTGLSKIVDYEGRLLAEAASGGPSLVANATIDIAALRARRRQCGLTNTLVRQPFQAYAESYAGTVFHAANHLSPLLTGQPLTTDTLRGFQQHTIESLIRRGLI